MKILIVNDDGIEAPAILQLAKWARKLGEVVVVAPRVEQSGKSQSVLLKEFFSVEERDLAEGIRAYAVDSNPADCVRYGLNALGEKFDLVLSGINRGLNIGAERMYSRTAGAATEAVFQGVKALALSSKMSYYDRAVSQMDRIYDYIVKHDLFALNDFYNINIPENPDGRIRITRQGKFRYGDAHEKAGAELVSIPLGPRLYEPVPGGEYDIDAVMEGIISITPVTLERTNLEVYGKLCDLAAE